MIIGPSVGFMYFRGFETFEEQEKTLEESGANALELAEIEPFFSKCGYLLETPYKNLEYISFHLENKSINLEKIAQMIKVQELKALVIHPIEKSKEYWKTLKTLDAPLAIENLDGRYPPNIFEEYMEIYQTNFVLDLEHAYEIDSKMKYGQRIFEKFKKQLVHLHLSGKIGNETHTPIHKSKNKDTIMSFAKELFSEKKVPIILEGGFNNTKELRKEIDFIKNKLI